MLELTGFWWARKLAEKLTIAGLARTELTICTQTYTEGPANGTRASDTVDSMWFYYSHVKASRSVAGQERGVMSRNYPLYNMAIPSGRRPQRNRGTGNKKAVAV